MLLLLLFKSPSFLQLDSESCIAGPSASTKIKGNPYLDNPSKLAKQHVSPSRIHQARAEWRACLTPGAATAPVLQGRRDVPRKHHIQVLFPHHSPHVLLLWDSLTTSAMPGPAQEQVLVWTCQPCYWLLRQLLFGKSQVL